MAPPLRLPKSNGFLCRSFGQPEYFRNHSAFFPTAFSSNVAIWWTPFLDFFFSTPEDLCTVRLAHTVQLFLSLKTSWMSFFCRGLVYSFGHQKTLFFYHWPEALFVFPTPEEDFRCLKKTCDAWRSLMKLSTLEDIVHDVNTKSSA